MANFDMIPLDVRDDWYQSYTHQVEHSWFLVFKTHPSGWAFVLGEKLWRRSRKIPRRCLRLFLFVLSFFSVLFLAETLCFIFQVLYLILSQAKFQLSLLSSPRAKRAGPKGLRAGSARAFTRRRNSYSGRGEDFLSRQPDFFTETAVTSERKVEKSFPRWEINRHVEG